MDIILWILFGAITAWIAAIFIGTGTRQQIMGSIILGIIGAVFAGMTMRVIAGQHGDTVNFYSLLLAVAGSLLIVVITAHKRI